MSSFLVSRGMQSWKVQKIRWPLHEFAKPDMGSNHDTIPEVIFIIYLIKCRCETFKIHKNSTIYFSDCWLRYIRMASTHQESQWQDMNSHFLGSYRGLCILMKASMITPEPSWWSHGDSSWTTITRSLELRSVIIYSSPSKRSYLFQVMV